MCFVVSMVSLIGDSVSVPSPLLPGAEEIVRLCGVGVDPAGSQYMVS